jgi:hypothetical protein
MTPKGQTACGGESLRLTTEGARANGVRLLIAHPEVQAGTGLAHMRRR